MKIYENYLIDEDEQREIDMHKELSQTINDGFKYYGVELTDNEIQANGEQCKIVESAYQAVVNLLQIENIEMCTGNYYFYFSVIYSSNETENLESASPKLSRNKLLRLKLFEVANVIVDMFLDRGNWSDKQYISYKISDGNGNYLI